MSSRVFISVVISVTAAVAAGCGPAQAQLFFPGWSGGGAATAQSRPARLPRPAARSHSYRSAPAYRMLGRWSPYAARSRYQSDESEVDGRESWSGSYRTLCVRLCDGYFFPVSYRTTRSRMYRDARICESSCNCETRLFYLPSASSDVKHATDLTGQSYGRLDNAFEYKQSYDRSCTCRPQPWSVSEQYRHEEYALVEAERRAEFQERKGEAILALIAREDAREAEAEAARLARLEDQQRRLAERRGRLQRLESGDVRDAEAAGQEKVHELRDLAAAAPAEAAGVLMPTSGPGGTIAGDVEPAPDGASDVSTMGVSAAGGHAIAPVSLWDPPVVTPAGGAPMRPTGKRAGRASSPVKFSRPTSRGFWQM